MLLEKKDNVLHFDGLNTVEMADKYGTPVWLLSQDGVEEKIKELKECFTDKYPKNRIAYACKVLCTMGMMKFVEKQGLCIDVVSGGELYTAIKAGFPPERIEFNGNNKSPEEIELAVDYGIGRIIIDGLQELSLIERICKEKNKKMKVLYRITPEVNVDTHEYVITGKKDSKFGIPLDEDVIMKAFKDAIDSEYVDFYGIHFHVGSQLFDNSAHMTALEVTLDLVTKIKEKFDYDVKEINVGGGFGIKYVDEVAKSYAYFLDPVMDRIKEYYDEKGLPIPAVVTEPGRSLLGESGITLYTVGSIKNIKDIRTYVSIDGGMSDNIRPALYDSKYYGEIANKMDEPKTEKVTICGKCCESGDVLIKDIDIAKPEAGDIFAMYSTGAYSYTLSLNYNRNRIPGIIFTKDGKDRVLLRPQSYDQLLINDMIPEDL